MWNETWETSLIESLFQLFHKQVLEKMKYKRDNIERTTFTVSLGNIFLDLIFAKTHFMDTLEENANEKKRIRIFM